MLALHSGLIVGQFDVDARPGGAWVTVGEELPGFRQLPEVCPGSEDPAIPTFMVAEFE